MQRLVDYLIERLARTDLDSCFLVNGRGVLHLTDALAKSSLKAISCHHEQAAGFAALAYAKYRRSLGLCMVSTGCAAANALTPLLCAWQDEVPVIFISGQHSLKESNTYRKLEIRTFGQQETDLEEVVSPWCKYFAQINDPKKAGEIIEKALFLAQDGVPGPVWLDIPLDVQNMRVNEQNFENHQVLTKELKLKFSLDQAQDLLDELYKAKRPILLVGTEIYTKNAQISVERLIEALQIPVVFENGSCDVYGRAHDLAIGAVGSLGCSRAGNIAVQNSDFILSLGSKLNSQLTGDEGAKFAREAKIIALILNPHEFEKGNIKVTQVLEGEVGEFVEKLLPLIKEPINTTYLDFCQKLKNDFPLADPYCTLEKEIDLYAFADALSPNLTSEGDCFITDAGLEELIMPATLEFGKGVRCLQAFSQGCMGFALPAVIGAFNAGAKRVCAVVGDGSMMFNLQELQTISYFGLNLKLFVMNNNGYAIIKKRQKDLFRRRTIGNDPSDGLSLPNWQQVAQTFGLAYCKIEEKQNLSQQIKEVMSQDGAVLCEVCCTSTQAFLHNSYTRDSKGRFVRRSLEDQSPFLEEQVLRDHMLIPVIDR